MALLESYETHAESCDRATFKVVQHTNMAGVYCDCGAYALAATMTEALEWLTANVRPQPEAQPEPALAANDYSLEEQWEMDAFAERTGRGEGRGVWHLG